MWEFRSFKIKKIVLAENNIKCIRASNDFASFDCGHNAENLFIIKKILFSIKLACIINAENKIDLFFS